MLVCYLSGFSIRFQKLSRAHGQVTYVLLTRSPLDSEKQAFLPLVRLACIRHAASVHPEPGSNSLKFVSYPPKRLQSISELVLLFTLPRNFRFPELLCCVFSDANLRVPCFFRCLIFKVLGTFLSVRLSLSLDPSLKCSTILPLPAPFVNTFFQLFWSFFQLLLHLSGRSVTLGVIISYNNE